MRYITLSAAVYLRSSPLSASDSCGVAAGARWRVRRG